MQVLFEPSNEFIRTVNLITNPVDAKKSLLLPKAFKACPESWINVYWIMIVPGSHEDVGV